MSTNADLPPCGRLELPGSRREFLTRAGAGFGALALADLLASDARGSDAPHVERHPDLHPPAKAKSVIFLFMEGGPSHIDLFDPKPKLNELAGQKLPASFKPVITPMGEVYSPLLECKRSWRQRGKSGAWVSDWLPHTAGIVDEIAILRSCIGDGLNHVGSVCQMNTGSVLGGRPSLGSWVLYGLGTPNRNLPGFVVLLDRDGTIAGGPRNWGPGFMPAEYQGTRFRSGPQPVRFLHPKGGADRARLRRKLDLLKEINTRHARTREKSELDARIEAYELAFRMQREAPEAVDLAGETEATKSLYGLDKKETRGMGRSCLLARRLVERGVRFVQVYSGAGSKWDAHSAIEKNHTELCRSMDQPVAALVQDLKSRGLLDETLVVWGGEFGRTPMSEKGDGRDHNPYGFTMWFAGAGIRPGQTIGETDELGLHAISSRTHVRDIHATILHLLGLSPRELNYFHDGRRENVVINEGRVVDELLA